MKCTKCDKQADYVINGHSVCKKHAMREEEVKEAGETMGDQIAGKLDMNM